MDDKDAEIERLQARVDELESDLEAVYEQISEDLEITWMYE